MRDTRANRTIVYFFFKVSFEKIKYDLCMCEHMSTYKNIRMTRAFFV